MANEKRFVYISTNFSVFLRNEEEYLDLDTNIMNCEKRTVVFHP